MQLDHCELQGGWWAEMGRAQLRPLLRSLDFLKSNEKSVKGINKRIMCLDFHVKMILSVHSGERDLKEARANEE